VSADALRPFTAAWAEAFRIAIEADEPYHRAAAQWTRPMALVLMPAPEVGYPEALALELQLDRGRCHGAQIVPADAVTAPIVLTAPYAVWKSIVRGELDPIVSVTQGTMSVRGELTALMMHARVATALLACAKALPTAFPDEA
jgi:putative sterol carrier protein